MPTGLALLNCLTVAIFLAAMVAMGAWAGRGQVTSEAFLLSDRSLPWWPVGMSLAVAGFAAVWYCGIPNEAYWAGVKFLPAAGLLWAGLPIVCWCVIPLYGTLELESVFEYLELRFDPAVRAVAGGVYVAGMVLWLGGILALPCTALGLGGELDVTVLLVVVSTAAAVTLYTYLGGMKATVWTDVGQFVLLAAVLVATLIIITVNLGEGPSRIWEVAEELGRTHVAEAIPERPAEWTDAWRKWSFWSAEWSIWAVIPYLAILPLFFFVADQATLQRLFAAKDNRGRTFSYFLGCGLTTLAIPLATLLGLGLLAVYHDNAQQEMSPAWVLNSATNPKTGERLVSPDVVLDRETAEKLVSDRAILDPNTDRPFTDARQFINSRGEPVIDALATRAPRPWGGDRLGPFWPLPLGLAATLVVGYLSGFVVGSRKSRDELTGLVFGMGRWGHLLEIEHPRDEVYWIEVDEEEPPGPWA